MPGPFDKLVDELKRRENPPENPYRLARYILGSNADIRAGRKPRHAKKKRKRRKRHGRKRQAR